MTPRRRILTILGTAAAVVAGAVAIFHSPPTVPKGHGIDPFDVTATAQTRAGVRVAWQQKSSPWNFPVKYNRVRVLDLSPPGCQWWSADGGILRYRRCIHARDGGAGCYLTDAGVTKSCTYIPDGGMAQVPTPDAGFNWDAATAFCWCDRDGGVRDSGAPGYWNEQIPPDSTAHLIPCSAPGTACPADWFAHGWSE